MIIFLAVFIISYNIFDLGRSIVKTRENKKEFDYYQYSYIHYLKNKLYVNRTFKQLFKYILPVIIY